MKFATLEEAQTAYDALEPKVSALETEKTALTRKRDELLGEVKTLKDKYKKFADYADQDLDIAGLLEIEKKYTSGSDEAKSKYEAAYLKDKAALESRLKAIEDERNAEKAEVEKQRQQSIEAQLKADAIAEFSKESHRIRNPEQFWRLFGQGNVQRGEDGKLYHGDEYRKLSLSDYIAKVNEDEDNAHHFRARGGSGSGTTSSNNGGGKVTVNPWMPKTRNLTQQGQILRSNPELAARLKAEAGVK